MVYDILIIGSGGAALSAALAAKESGANILVASEGYPTRSQTCMAQGGINAALGNSEPDNPEMHIEDTIRASGRLASQGMVQALCEDAPATVAWLEKIGVPFSRTAEGKIAQRSLGGASSKRACYSQDYTGLKILHTLYDQSLKEDIEFLHEHHLLDFCLDDGKITGAAFYNIRTGDIITIDAKSVIVATGGYSGIYYGNTTNTYQSTGDGVAAALRAGAALSNMEFVQFHPTALKGSGVLISESARGAGGILVTESGERFVDELKPRDVVSRAIWNEISKGREVFLDIRHLDEAFIDENIPQERKLCITYAGIDPVHTRIPIAPVAHYSMGGIDVDKRMMSSISGLFAVGECANAHIHGANRLGGNSLLEIVSMGRKTAKEATRFAHTRTDSIQNRPQPQKRIEHIMHAPDKIDFYAQREQLGRRFYTQAGIVRNGDQLQEALSHVREVQRQLPDMGITDHGKIYNTNLIERLKFENSLLLAEAILHAALLRQESRGAHFREDYPEPDPKYEKESLTTLEKGEIRTQFQKVAS